MTQLWYIGYLLTVTLSGALVYFAPLVYAAVAILVTCVVAGIVALAGTNEKERDSGFKVNFILQTLFFWPINVYELVYLGLKMYSNNKGV